MLEVYAFATPNSINVPIAPEELGLDCALRGATVRKGVALDESPNASRWYAEAEARPAVQRAVACQRACACLLKP